MIRVLLVDDQRLILDGLRTILDSDPELSVVATATTGEAAVESFRRERPDVSFVDIRMPDVSGVQLIERLLAIDPRSRLVALTTFAEDELVIDVVRSGARGYLLKDASAEELIEAVKEVHRGGIVFARDVVGIVVDALRSRLADEGAPLDHHLGPERPQEYDLLSEREREVLPLIADGLTNRAIARRLHVTEGTVKNHISSITRKLRLRSRTEIAAFVWRHGLQVQVDDVEAGRP